MTQTNLSGTVRQPRLQILSNGTPIGGVISAEVKSNNHYHADTFSAELAINTDPSFGIDWLGNLTPPAYVDIQFALLTNGVPASWTSIVYGQIDHVTVHPTNGVATIEGRDLSSLFIDVKTQETFQNQTSSQVAATLAGRHGLQTNIDPTTEIVGHYYANDHTNMSLGSFSRTTTEWDLLVFLAQREGYDVYVSGQTLYFKESVTSDPSPWIVQVPGVIRDGSYVSSSVMRLSLERSLSLAKDIEVQVKSWNSQTASGFTKYAGAHGPKSAAASGNDSTVQRYVFVRPGLTQQQAQELATTYATQISQNERVVTWSEPGDMSLTVRNMARLTGTNAASWGQDYYIDSITRRLDMRAGFTMDVRAKNVTPESQASVG